MPILTVDNPMYERILHRPGKKVKAFQSPEIKILTQEMKKIASQPGAAGVAATQLGQPYRIFALHVNKEYEPVFFFNPKVISMSEETHEVIEGCLSVPNMQGRLERHLKIKISWQDELGRKVAPNGFKYEFEFEGFEAQAVQHEMDHLDGKLYIDVAEDIVTNSHLEKVFQEALAREAAENALKETIIDGEEEV